MHNNASGVQHDCWAVASGLQNAACLASTADGLHMAVGGTSLNGTAAVHFISRAGEGLRYTFATSETVCPAGCNMRRIITSFPSNSGLIRCLVPHGEVQVTYKLFLDWQHHARAIMVAIIMVSMMLAPTWKATSQQE